MSAPLKNLNEFVFDRDEVIRQAVQASDHVVARQSGAYGFAVKAAYTMTKGLAPNMVHTLVDGLLEDFLDALTPFYHEAVRANVPVSRHVIANKLRIADALLNITDVREQHEKHGFLKNGYRKLRPKALERLAEAAPELGELLEKNIPAEHKPGADRVARVALAAAV